MLSISRREGLRLAAGGVAAAWAGVALGQGTGRTLALVEKRDARLAFYALPGGRLLGSVPLGPQPHELAADAAGRFAYIGGYGVESWHVPGEGGHVIWVVDLPARRLVRTIDLSPYARLHGVRLDAAGRLYVLSETGGVLARFDRPATDTTPSRLAPVGGARSHYLVVRRDGSRAYAADTLSGGVIMVAPDNLGFAPVKRAIGTAPEGMALGRDERVVYVLDRPAGVIHALDAATLAPLGQRTMRGEAARVVTLADGRLVVSNIADRSLSRLDPASLAEEARLSLPAAANALNLSGGTLYASLDGDRVAIVDLAAWRITGGFATGGSPDTGAVF